MRVIVDPDLCEDNAVCVGEAPEIFGLDEQGRMVVLHDDPPPEIVAEARRAVARCPRAALSLSNDR